MRIQLFWVEEMIRIPGWFSRNRATLLPTGFSPLGEWSVLATITCSAIAMPATATMSSGNHQHGNRHRREIPPPLWKAAAAVETTATVEAAAEASVKSTGPPMEAADPTVESAATVKTTDSTVESPRPPEAPRHPPNQLCLPHSTPAPTPANPRPPVTAPIIGIASVIIRSTGVVPVIIIVQRVIIITYG